jgi:hypothetical protein
LAGAFFRQRGLIAFAAGGAMAEATLLSFLAPSARALAPQVTALPPLAAFHDLRWLFAFNQPWLGFTRRARAPGGGPFGRGRGAGHAGLAASD